jgi:hypothetical protein
VSQKWQKVTAAVLLVVVGASVVLFHSRASADFWPLDNSRVGPNLVASIVQAVVVLILAALLWPPTRHAIERFAQRHADSLKSRLTMDANLIHAQLSHIIKHHPDIPPFTTRKETPHMFDLASIEHRFDFNAHDLSDALHSQVAKVIEDAAKAVLPLLPEGSVVDDLLAHFDHAAAEAHKLVAAAAPVVEAVDPAAAPVVAEAEAVTAEAPATVAAVVDPEPVAPAPAEPAAPAVVAPEPAPVAPPAAPEPPAAPPAPTTPAA